MKSPRRLTISRDNLVSCVAAWLQSVGEIPNQSLVKDIIFISRINGDPKEPRKYDTVEIDVYFEKEGGKIINFGT